ncbi:MAG TPA: hypothetical protein VJ863_01055 [Sphaerochaeta sp.]|nr:hypothetical protein [Sphaerochaeta sp.]
MKRHLLLPLVLILLASPLVGKSFGYGLGMYGQSDLQDRQASSSGVELSFVYQPWLLPVGNPSVHIKGAMGSDMQNSLIFPYVELGFSVDLFRVIDHPFNVFSNNIVAYDPAVSVAYHFDVEHASHLMSFGVSPFKLSQKDFWYEFFAFYVAVDVESQKVDNWGINLVRYTYIFK